MLIQVVLPRSIAQFLSAFLLLGIGTVISVSLLAFEHFYMQYLMKAAEKSAERKKTPSGYLSLISMVRKKSK